ncbi:MAG: isoprenylcysteine carboxylmethyltransferase family protein [Deltaproteobacteria bacterium]|nr:MAG: isoprenylcysteine carboxylmethyltransferase family protein [Deltaproteobacteria bacterium]
MSSNLLKTIIILPGTVLVFVPTLILIATYNTRFSFELIGPDRLLFWPGLAAAGLGLFLAVWTVTLFTKFGQGTPAPWDPPQKLVIRGPYRFVRNPMITGVLSMLLAETLLLKSWPIFLWLLVFFLLNSVYFPLVEERSLEKRFGADYLEYKKHVPRWIPRLTPWKPPDK